MGEYSGAYQTQDPNVSDEEMDLQAAQAWAMLKRGVPMSEIVVTLGISRSTLYRRWERLTLKQPGKWLRRMLEDARLESLTLRIENSIESADSVLETVALVREARQLSQARSQLHKLVDEQDASPASFEDPLANLPPALLGAMKKAEARAKEMEDNATKCSD